MYKNLLKIFIVLALVFGVYKTATTIINVKDLKDNITVTKKSEEIPNTSENIDTPKEDFSDNSDIESNASLDSKELNDKIKNKLASIDINSSNEDIDSRVASSLDNPDDYTVAISSSLYNAIILLDKPNKEVNIKIVDESVVKSSNTDRYVNLSDEDIKYLLSNSSSLLDEFKSGNLIEKYDFVRYMLDKYDTNIKESDLISLAFAYLN